LSFILEHTEKDTMTEDIPEHHKRYARAWSLYQDKTLSKDAKIALEREMDSAQNHFSWDEFQVFKATLPNFVDFWEIWRNKLEQQM